MSPFVTVLMPVYNGEQFLREAVESILSQTFTDFEFLVIDDGSSDKSPSILTEYAKKDSRIRIHTQPRNMGVFSALNLGIQIAKGKYIARMDADDISLPERLKKQITYLETHPEIGVLGTAANVIDVSGNHLDVMDYPSSHPLLLWALCFYCPIIHPSVIVQRNLLLASGGYTTKFPLAEDYELWVRLSRTTRLANLPERLLLLRKHSTNVSFVHKTQQLENSAAISKMMISELTGREAPISPLELAWTHRRISADELAQVVGEIQSLYEHFSRLPLTAMERKILRREYGLQQARLLRNCSPTLKSVMILFQVLRYDPSVIGEILQLGLKNIFNRQR